MKKIFLSLIFLSFTVFADDCTYTNSFSQSGWKIHDSKNFGKYANFVKTTIKNGLDDKSVVFDLSGPIMTRSTVDGLPILLDAMMFDNLKTPQDEMYGDYAFLEIVNDTRDLVEVRWYNGKERNIVFNPKFLKCMSEAAPYVDNAVL